MQLSKKTKNDSGIYEASCFSLIESDSSYTKSLGKPWLTKVQAWFNQPGFPDCQTRIIRLHHMKAWVSPGKPGQLNQALKVLNKPGYQTLPIPLQFVLFTDQTRIRNDRSEANGNCYA